MFLLIHACHCNYQEMLSRDQLLILIKITKVRLYNKLELDYEFGF